MAALDESCRRALNEQIARLEAHVWPSAAAWFDNPYRPQRSCPMCQSPLIEGIVEPAPSAGGVARGVLVWLTLLGWIGTGILGTPVWLRQNPKRRFMPRNRSEPIPLPDDTPTGEALFCLSCGWASKIA